MFKRNRQKGFTLIELLIVVAIIGIIAAILIPNLLDALQKAKQKRTVADVRNTGTAWMSWLIDINSAASAGQTGTGSGGSGKSFYGTSHATTVTYAEMFGFLRPTDTFFYMQEVPPLDGWGGPINYAMATDLAQASTISIYSGARDKVYVDGTPSTDMITYGFLSTDYDQDIVWADGYFVRWPAGTKR
jgi:prepilin-type N-terminal cleavage/methylation domain-containing protein